MTGGFSSASMCIICIRLTENKFLLWIISQASQFSKYIYLWICIWTECEAELYASILDKHTQALREKIFCRPTKLLSFLQEVIHWLVDTSKQKSGRISSILIILLLWLVYLYISVDALVMCMTICMFYEIDF